MMKRIISMFLMIVLLLAGCGYEVETKTWQEQYDLGVALLSEGKHEEAILAFETAIAMDPQQPDAYVRLVEIYIEQGDYEAAKTVLERALIAVVETGTIEELLESVKREIAGTEEGTEDMDPPGQISTKNITVSFEINTEDRFKEYGTITAVDTAGNVLWTITTLTHEAAQLSLVGEIGTWQDRYYYIDYPAVVAVDLLTGEELWKNEEFVGSAYGGHAIAEDGTVYLAGNLGPDFFAVDKDGNTKARIDHFDPAYCGAEDVTILKSGKIAVTLSSQTGSGDLGEYQFLVDPVDYSYVMETK